jgi:hypothetical protein
MVITPLHPLAPQIALINKKTGTLLPAVTYIDTGCRVAHAYRLAQVGQDLYEVVRGPNDEIIIDEYNLDDFRIEHFNRPGEEWKLE